MRHEIVVGAEGGYAIGVGLRHGLNPACVYDEGAHHAASVGLAVDHTLIVDEVG